MGGSERLSIACFVNVSAVVLELHPNFIDLFALWNASVSSNLSGSEDDDGDVVVTYQIRGRGVERPFRRFDTPFEPFPFYPFLQPHPTPSTLTLFPPL